MPVQLNGATSGSVTLTVPGTAGTNTLTLPAKTGNIITSADTGTVTQTMLSTNVAGNGPAFDAYYSGAGQSISAATNTKVQLNATTFNQGSCFDATTNYRFTPTVAGYYQLNAQARVGTVTGLLYVFFYKNGTTVVRTNSNFGNGTNATNSTVSSIIYLNGSTDYIEFYVYTSTATTLTKDGAGTSDVSWMNGALIRSA